jgi:hypothetical protein
MGLLGPILEANSCRDRDRSGGPATFGRPVGQGDHRRLDLAAVDFVRSVLRERYTMLQPEAHEKLRLSKI